MATDYSKRNFLKALGIAIPSMAAGYFTRSMLEGETLIWGEEWRKNKVANPKDLHNLRPDAEVLAEARQRITQLRTGSFVHRLTMPDGTPLQNQVVRAELTAHPVEWGLSMAGSAALLKHNEAHQKMTRHFARLFTHTTAKCYWEERWHQPIEKHQGLRVYDKFLDEIAWAKQAGVIPKGHPLVWTVPKAIPKWMANYDYERQLAFWEEHVRSLIRVAGPDVPLWDLCNEMLWEPTFRKISQRQWPHIEPVDQIAEYIAMAMRWARAENPQARYGLNDYGLELTYRPEISAGEQRARYLQLVEALKALDATPDMLGTQAHVGGRFRYDVFLRSVEELSQAGLPVHITEFWVSTPYKLVYIILLT